ncbi:hypothetical protein [Marinobacterium aestuariivivens]|uniref:PAS domain-containing protein n=1 Tax=Marinobacterium aestuariivivens TaxID=1698799 RepID=A0ABW2A1T9_9GAMM
MIVSNRQLLPGWAHGRLFRTGILFATLLLCLLIWILDPLVDARLLGNSRFLDQLLSPSRTEIYVRSLMSLTALIAGLVIAVLQRRLSLQYRLLNEQRESLQQIIRAEPECVKTLSRSGELLQMNPAGLAMIEADSLEQVQGRCVYDLIAPEDRDAFMAFNRRIFAGESVRLQYRVIGLKGARPLSTAMPCRCSTPTGGSRHIWR